VLADHFFHAAFGGSVLNHFWLVCACTPTYANPPAELVAQLDDNDQLVKDGAITPDGFVVNTLQPFSPPYAASASDPAKRLPPQSMPTIGDRLDEKAVSWAWYAGGWKDAVAGHPPASFQFHHQSFVYFAKFADGTEARKQHLKDEKHLIAGIAAGDLPAVVFYKPVGVDNQHPGYANLVAGDTKVAEILRALEKSDLWDSTVAIITYDENGGFWDHVSPPAGDRWGPGARVPTIIVSPYAKRGFVDHTPYDTTSILKFIEVLYDLQPLGERDKSANDLSNAFTP
jgi:phospholipase C